MALFGKNQSKKKPAASSAAPKRPLEGAALERLVLATLVAPRVTEKAHRVMAANQYVFRVNPRATKQSVKKAVESAYQVHVTKVNMTATPSQWRFFRGKMGRTQRTKKAVVTLKAGESIDVFKSA